MPMLIVTKLKDFFKRNQPGISLFLLVFLLVMLAFGIGLIVGRSLSKPSLEFKEGSLFIAGRGTVYGLLLSVGG